ncbi:PAS domain S-box-containing protein [Chitinophaga skermanii]|uniref:histidine kinase n=1 Tax=Chitinophaga skermanii TaxID=331697 RepID=A0A327RAK7_9BACT|nr:PAS domain-containing sensor histidine kinase [Chitinophaga skermanii]RAJ10957.1 PAS domain S-box-containing protein [Chitinophaga skermanii]
MFRFGQKSILFISCLVLIITVYLLIWRPDYNFFDGGLITVILLSLFIKDDTVTSWMGIICTLVVLTVAFLPHKNPNVAEVFIEHFFSLILVIGTTMLVLFVKRLYRTLEADENQLTALFKHANEGIILTNQQGEIVLANPEAERLFGYSAEEMLNQKIEMLIPRRFTGQHVQHRSNFAKKPTDRKMGTGMALFALRKDGSEFAVEVSLSHFNQGRERYVLAFIIDVTLRKESENNLLAQKKQLEELTQSMQALNTDLEQKVDERTKNLQSAMQQLETSQSELEEALAKEKELSEIKSRFVSMASHEFRTPLSAILSSAALIGKYTQTDDQPRREKHVNKIREAVKHLNELLEDFLSLGRIEEGKVQISLEVIPLQGFMAETSEEVQGLLKQGQTLQCSVDPHLQIIADRRLLKHIFVNLLTNASKFSPVEAPITWTISRHENQVICTVADRGMGIPAEDKAYLFTSFFRGKNVTNIQGTGLGLHIVKRYVDMLDGTIEVDSELGKGTTITITFPNNIA